MSGHRRERRPADAGRHSPKGVRHRLGLAGEVIVSTNRELAVVRIWSAARLDELIGGEA